MPSEARDRSKNERNKSAMEIKNEVKGNAVVIYLSGNLLGENANGPVLDFIKQQIEAGRTHVVVNLADLKFINSTGLGMLMTALARVRNAGGEMYLCHLPELMVKLLKMMKLDQTFLVTATEAEALAKSST
jgi:anti-sigma B factor antagonist